MKPHQNKSRSERLWPLLLIAGGLLCASVAAGLILTGSGVCSVCRDVLSPRKSVPLALAGGLSYALALALFAVPAARRTGALVLSVVAGVHLVLLLTMIVTGEFCGLCVVAALGVGVALLGTVCLREAPNALMWGGTVSGLVVAYGLLWLVSHTGVAEWFGVPEPEYQIAMDEARRLPPAADGSMLVVVFERRGCSACQFLAAPEQRRSYESVLETPITVVRKDAPPALPVPTIVVNAESRWYLFRGAPTAPQLRNHVLPGR